MRKRALLGLVGLLVLAGCGHGSSPTATTPPAASPAVSADPAADMQALEQVVVDASGGGTPQVTLPSTPFSVSTPVARLVSDGDGAALATGQGMLVRELTVSGVDGSTMVDAWADAPQGGLVVGDNSEIGNFDAVLTTAHVGALVLVAIPASAAETDLFLLEITDTYAMQATGTAVPAVAGLPVVAVDAAGVPTGITASGTPPTSLVVQPLIAGDGPKTAAGQTVIVQYTGWLWDGTKFDSSWDNGSPFSFKLGASQVIAGWDEGVAGQSVGSRVLLVVPPDKGYGDQDNGTIPPGSTLVFVVDILAAA